MNQLKLKILYFKNLDPCTVDEESGNISYSATQTKSEDKEEVCSSTQTSTTSLDDLLEMVSYIGITPFTLFVLHSFDPAA